MVHAHSFPAENYFLNDIRRLRERADMRMRMPDLAPRAGRPAKTSIELLQTALSAEIVCVLRYTNFSVSAFGLMNDAAGAEFQEQANDERRHMRQVARRIRELGGTPDFSALTPESRTMPPLNDGGSVAAAVRQNLLAEQGVIEHYRVLIGYFSDRDPRTAAMLETILLDEENHVTDMHDLLCGDGGEFSPSDAAPRDFA